MKPKHGLWVRAGDCISAGFPERDTSLLEGTVFDGLARIQDGKQQKLPSASSLTKRECSVRY